ncbi:MAG: MBL fold metallo-hydrolase [Tidjanibacter sp.]|nr:MBL fold metallo-hydrolase [Tidjanibacter sp.]
MKITIHRGADQIGGCITEICSESGNKIFIDLGHNLPSENDEPDKYDTPTTLSTLLEGVSAVVYTHNHGDHAGFFAHIPEDIPQYMGAMGREVMQNTLKEQLRTAQRAGRTQRADELSQALLRVDGFCTYAQEQAFYIGDIKLTPYLVSHSAGDSYMLLVECDGKRILHTGDFRDHGFIGPELLPTIESIVCVDVLIIEGTMLSRSSSATHTEQQIMQEMKEQMKLYKNIFVVCSSTNFDRLAGLHKATQEFRGRPFVCDTYQKQQLDTLTTHSGKCSPLYIIKNARQMSLKSESLHRQMFKNGFTMIVRNNSTFRKWINFLKEHIDLNETLCIYSQYHGYLDEQPTLREFVDSFGCKVEYIHTSGHASPQAIELVCRTLNPRSAIIPIHKEASSDFHSLDLPDDLKAKIISTEDSLRGIKI